jgi:hypothetical protein
VMSKRQSSGDAVRRAKAAQIKKPFPWGTVAGAAVLVLFLGAIMVYAVKNTGASAPTPLRDADAKFDGLVKADQDDLGRDHKGGILSYAQDPPVGGDHNGAWQNCAVYAEQIPKEQAVHSLEHGAVWITYQPDLPAGDVKKLSDKVSGNPYALLSPYPGLKTKVSAQAWGRQLTFDSVDDGDIEEFVDTYADGPQKPERAACSGGVSTIGNIPTGGAAPAPQAPSGAPSGAATGAPSTSAPAATPSS